jgi:ABC-type uncharacterized transport system ATPase subunit
MSDHVAMMNHGRVTLSGPLDDVRREYQHSRVHFVQRFDDAPVLDGALLKEGSAGAWRVIHLAFERMQTVLTSIAASRRARERRRGTVRAGRAGA